MLDHSILSYFILGLKILSVISFIPLFLRLFDVLEPGMCHFIDCKADPSSAMLSIDAFHLSLEVIRGDRQRLKSNFL